MKWSQSGETRRKFLFRVLYFNKAYFGTPKTSVRHTWYKLETFTINSPRQLIDNLSIIYRQKRSNFWCHVTYLLYRLMKQISDNSITTIYITTTILIYLWYWLETCTSIIRTPLPPSFLKRGGDWLTQKSQERERWKNCWIVGRILRSGWGDSVGKGFTGCTLPVSITQLLVPVIGHIIPVCIMEVFLLVLVFRCGYNLSWNMSIVRSWWENAHIQFNLWSVCYDMFLYDGTWCQLHDEGSCIQCQQLALY